MAAISARQSSLSSHAAPFYTVSVIFLTLAVVSVALRLYIRFRITRNPWWDDGAAVLALLSQAAAQGIIFRLGTLGLGMHFPDVPRENLPEFMRLGASNGILSVPVLGFTKLAILLLYLRLFSRNTPVKLGIWTGIISCSIFYTVTMFLFIFVNRAAQVAVNNATGIFGIISDLYILCLPLFAIRQLNLSRKKKWRIAAVFLTGLLAVIMSFLACIYRYQLDITDISFSVLRIYIVRAVEVDVGIVCCCLPLLPALFKDQTESWWLTGMRSLRRRFGERSSGSGSGSGSNNLNGSGLVVGYSRRGYLEGASDSLGDNIQLVRPLAS
ncbi:hypothetical protein BDW62DRAFT_127477 [Aspergillus aurantiobrunneus]